MLAFCLSSQQYSGVLGKTKFLDPILDTPDFLIKIPANENHVIIGGLLVLLSAFACAGIAIGLYPVLRKQNAALALGSVALRGIETMLYIVGVVCVLSLITLSQGYVLADASNASSYQISGTLLLAVKDSAGQLSVVAFTLGGLMYYYVLFRSKLIPRWLSGWGIVGVASSLICILVNDIWSANSIFDGFHFIATPNRLAGNGPGGMADR